MSLKLTYYMKKNILILIFFNLLISGIDDIYETRFEKFWKTTFNKMNFREPISIVPYNLKIGYYNYGGDDYWENIDDIFKGEESLGNSPYDLLDSNFPNISHIKYRKGLMVELDILKYNFFKNKQNFIDILFGIGYKYNRTNTKSYKIYKLIY